MQNVDILLINATVLTMDAAFQTYENGAVAITGDSIIAAGPESDIRQKYNAEKIVDCQGKVLMPGLVNAHTHVPMTLLRGLADDLRLDVWLMGYMMPVEREFVSPDFVRLGTGLACAEMIRSGVTSFADMYYFEEDVAAATTQAGMRAVCSQSVLKFPTPDAQSYEESLAMAREYIIRWKGHPLIVPSVAPHAVYTCTAEILKATAALAVEFDVPLHTHISETTTEVENVRNEHGMPVIPYLRKQNLFDAKVLAAHCVHVDEGEMRSMLHAGAGVSHNPSSNLKLASGAAPVKKMIEVGLNVGIGTDGPASNNDLDMFEEMRLAALLSKGISGDPTALPALTVLSMATRLGAQAMHIGDITGSIEPGKRADLILVELNTLHNTPRFRRDPNGVYAQIVYAAKSTDVTDVMINGQWVMRGRNVLTVDEDALLLAAREYATKIDLFLMQREKFVLSKLLALGGATEEESFEVQIKVPLEDPQRAIDAIKSSPFELVRTRHYREYDTYFSFDDPEQGYLRYREDDSIDEKGAITNVRTRLTLIGTARERQYPSQRVLLSRSRFLAPATQSLRFYREYFQAKKMTEIEKERQRFLVQYKEIEVFVNIDHVYNPELGYFLEVKSRTWSRKDAEKKSHLIAEIITLLGADPANAITEDYVQMIESRTAD